MGVLGAVIVFVPAAETGAAFVPSGMLGMAFVLAPEAETAFVAPLRTGTVRRGDGNAGILGGAAGGSVCAGANCVNSRAAVII